jgi:tRNA (guanine-N7-)-methyltransferase|tara:strand:+ start:5326 stop:6000 length:675 start_codon:yes stop_codon:yes gene_type:complete
MGKDKLKRFSQLKTFKNVIQPQTNYLSEDDPVKGNWYDIFENRNPIIIELGCGAGEYTIGLARLFPNINFIGIDIKGARLWKGAKIAIDEKLLNVRFLRTKIDFINKFFAKNEIDEIWLTFSDPQPKKPRKRLTSELFINRYRLILKNKGVIHLKTDSDLLYQYTKEEIFNHNYYLIKDIKNIYNHNYINNSTLKEILYLKTFYEKKWIQMGKSIKYISFQLDF